MPTRSRNYKTKTKKQPSVKKRGTNLTQKKEVVQSLNYDKKLSSNYKNNSKNNNIPGDHISMDSSSSSSSSSSPTVQRIPPRYFEDKEHYSKQSVNIIYNISLNYMEYQKNLLMTYKESYFKILDGYSNIFGKESFGFEKYLNVYNNMYKVISENINNTTNIIVSIIDWNMNQSLTYSKT